MDRADLRGPAVAAVSDREEARRARLGRVRSRQRRAERRRSIAVIAGAAVLSCAVVAAVVVPLAREHRQQSQAAAAAARGIDGVQTFPDLSREHVTSAVSYPQVLPVGGDHAPVWTNCGAYEQSVPATQGVHSLEHGAVWIGYRPDLDGAQVQELMALAQANSYALLSPVADLPSPISLSAWGVQLNLDDAADPRVSAFVRRYQQGPQTPEPGAPCTGGAGAVA